MCLQVEWKKAVQRFILNNLGQMDQEDIDAWVDGELELAPLLAPPLRAQAQYRDQILRELHQITPPEILDRFRKEHPELVFKDNDKAILRIGKEFESLKAILISI